MASDNLRREDGSESPKVSGEEQGGAIAVASNPIIEDVKIFLEGSGQHSKRFALMVMAALIARKDPHYTSAMFIIVTGHSRVLPQQLCTILMALSYLDDEEHKALHETLTPFIADFVEEDSLESYLHKEWGVERFPARFEDALDVTRHFSDLASLTILPPNPLLKQYLICLPPRLQGRLTEKEIRDKTRGYYESRGYLVNVGAEEAYEWATASKGEQVLRLCFTHSAYSIGITIDSSSIRPVRDN